MMLEEQFRGHVHVRLSQFTFSVSMLEKQVFRSVRITTKCTRRQTAAACDFHVIAHPRKEKIYVYRVSEGISAKTILMYKSLYVQISHLLLWVYGSHVDVVE